VTIENITYAYDKAAEGNGFLEEFCYSEEEIAAEVTAAEVPSVQDEKKAEKESKSE